MVRNLAPLLVSIVLTSCASFYNMPPAETGVVEEAGEVQIAGQQGSKGRSLSASFGFHNVQKREFDADHLPLDSAEADSLIALGRVVRGLTCVCMASFSGTATAVHLTMSRTCGIRSNTTSALESRLSGTSGTARDVAGGRV